MLITRGLGERGERIEIKIDVAGADEGSRKVEELNRELGKSNSASRGAGQGLAGLGQQFMAAAGAATAAAAAIAGAAMAIRAFAGELERQAGVFNRFHGDISQARQATNGLVSDLRLMQAANEFAARGIRISGRDLRNVMVAAIERASATGRDLNQVLEQLTGALTSGSAEGLRQFGVQLQAGATTAENARKAFSQLETQFGQVESSADTAGGQLDVFRTALDNASTAMFEAIQDSGNLEGSFTQLFNAVTGGSGTFRQAMDQIVLAGRIMGATVGEIIERLTSLLGAHARGWRLLFQGNFAEAETAFASAQLGNFDSFVRDVRARYFVAEDAAEERRSQRVEQTTVGEPPRAPRPGGGRGGRGGGRRTRAEEPIDPRLAIEQALGLADQQAAERRRAEEFRAEQQRIQREADEARRRAEQRADIRRTGRDEGEDLDRFRDFAEGRMAAGAPADRYRQMLEEREDAHRAYVQTIRELEQQSTDWTAEEFQRRLDANREQLSMMREDARQAMERLKADSESVLTPVLSGFTKATAEVIAGTKGADEAFQGLLSSFLEMIAQQTALSAAKEFAEAIAAFASYRYDQGAQHLAAGAAFTAVAVAAGAASIAVAPSAAGGAAGPASPQIGAPEGQQGGGNITVNWNSPVVTAADRDQLGRELTQIIAGSRRRFGA